MTNRIARDSRTAEEKIADETREAVVAWQTREWELRRRDLESDYAKTKNVQIHAWLRKEIARCDRALMELGAGRLPEFTVDGKRNADICPASIL